MNSKLIQRISHRTRLEGLLNSSGIGIDTSGETRRRQLQRGGLALSR